MKRRQGRGMSPDDPQKSKSSAEMIGRMGEQLINAYLVQQVAAGELSSIEWVSNLNAVAPYDFKILTNRGTPRVLDVKSTASGFTNPIHLSMGEILAATEDAVPYDIYRTFRVTESSAMLRVGHDIGPAIRQTAEALLALPKGVSVDSVSIDPSILDFELAEVSVNLSEEDAGID